MSRMKLGLFKPARPTDDPIIANVDEAAVADRQERLAGLTPVEIAAVEALSQNKGVALAAR